MGPEREYSKELIVSPEGYYNDPRVVNALIQFMGGSGVSWSSIDSINSEFMGVGTREKLLSGKTSPVSTTRPEFVGNWIRDHSGYVELYMSMLQKETADHYPVRVPIFLDVERYGDKGWIYTHPQEVYTTMEPVYQLYRKFFSDRNLPFISVITGSGFHFVTSVCVKTDIDMLADIGNVIEPSVAGKHKQVAPDSKKTRQIDRIHELTFRGAVRLQQFINQSIIRSAREELKKYNLAVEIWDKGKQGIALDNTSAVFTVDNRSFGILGSLYFLKPTHYDIWLKRMIIRVPREGVGFEMDMNSIISARSSFEKSARILGSVNCRIPDCGQGLNGLINEYKKSGLYKLHQAMDLSWGDDPKDWGGTYRFRNYEGVIEKTEYSFEVNKIIRCANDQLLKPANMDFVVWQVFEAFYNEYKTMEVASHVAGFIRAILEDPQFNWGGRWHKNDAFRYARGCVEQILGQQF